MILTEQQIKDYLIREITFWLVEFGERAESNVGYEEAFLAKTCFCNMFEKIFGVEEFKKVYQDIYDKVYSKEI